MSKQHVGVEITDEEARQIAGNQLIVPDSAKIVTRKSYGEDIEVPQWVEICTIDDFICDFEPKDTKYADQNHEKARVQFRISDQYPTKNHGRRLTAFFDFFWGLRHEDPEQLKEWRETLKADDIRSTYYGRYFMTQRSIRKMGSLLRALGHEDRLAGKKLFKGFPTIMDIIPSMSGRLVAGTVEQLIGTDGEPRDELTQFSEV